MMFVPVEEIELREPGPMHCEHCPWLSFPTRNSHFSTG